MRTKNFAVVVTLSVAALVSVGCSSRTKTAVDADSRAEVQVIKAPGIVEYVWEEPRVNVVDVPPGLDPEGHYYRPAHQEVVEIRQGHWRNYQDPQGSK